LRGWFGLNLGFRPACAESDPHLPASRGIESGYGFFAPNVPDSSRLYFEIEFPDQRIASESLELDDAGNALRLASLVDYLGHSAPDYVREVILKLLAHGIWQEYPEATKVRVVLHLLKSPTAAEFKGGKRATFEFRYAYDFRRTTPPATTN